MQTTNNLSIRTFLINLVARRQLIWRVFLVMMILTMLVTFLLPAKYLLSGEVIVLAAEIYQKENNIAGEASNGTRYLPVSLKDIETEATLLRSLSLLRKTVRGLQDEGKLVIQPSLFDTVVKQPLQQQIIQPAKKLLGFETATDPVEEMLALVFDSLEILPIPGSNVIGVNYETDDIAQGKLVVDRLIDEYLAMRNTLMLASSENTFGQKKEMYKEQLNALANEKMKLLGQYDSQNPEEELSLTLQAVNNEKRACDDIADQLLEVGRWQTYLDNNIRRMEKTRAREISIPYGFDTTSNANDAELLAYKEIFEQLDQIRQLQNDYDSTAISFTRDSLPVAQATEKLEMAKKRLISLFKKRNQDQMQKMLVLKSIVEQKASRLAELKKRAQMLTEIQAKQTEIDTKLKVVNEAYFKYNQLYEEKYLDNLFAKDSYRNVKVLNYAPQPLEPSSPKKILLLLIGVFSSFLTAISAALVADFVKKSFYDPQELELALGLPVLAVVDELKPSAKKIKLSFLPAWFMRWINQ